MGTKYLSELEKEWKGEGGSGEGWSARVSGTNRGNEFTLSCIRILSDVPVSNRCRCPGRYTLGEDLEEDPVNLLARRRAALHWVYF